MAYDVSSLSSYSKEVGQDILKAVFYHGQSTKYARIVSGVGASFKIPKLSNSVVLQADGCDLSTSATTSFEQITLTPCSLAYVNYLCKKDLDNYFLSEYLPASKMKNDEIPFEQQLIEDITDRISLDIERIYWSGNTSPSCTGILNKIDGAYSGSVSTVTSTVTGTPTTSTIITLVDDIITDYTFDTAKEQSSLWMSPSNYKRLCVAYRSANFFGGGFDFKAEEGFYIPGSINVWARSTAGITSDDRMVCTWDKNLILGTKFEGDFTSLEVKFNEFTDIIRIKGAWSQTADIAYPAQVSHWSV